MSYLKFLSSWKQRAIFHLLVPPEEFSESKKEHFLGIRSMPSSSRRSFKTLQCSFWIFALPAAKLNGVYALGLSVFFSVHFLTRVNIFQTSWKFHRFTYIWQYRDCIENGTYGANGSSTEIHKSILLHYGLWGVNFKSIFWRIYIALNIMKLPYVIQTFKSMFPKENSINWYEYFMYMLAQKNSNILRPIFLRLYWIE